MASALLQRREKGNVKIVSGGQTGADRAALDWAIAHGFAHGGWCPKGRRAEDGIIPDAYCLVETPSSDYPQRTEWNVRDSDATVIFSIAPELTGGSKLTLELADALAKPCLHLCAGCDAGRLLRDFIERYAVEVLNVAGPRESGAPDIRRFVMAALSDAFRAHVAK